ncbi:hypothetical protein E2C01_037447 [Portunus trituberculatus]|uniref:Uncharacterized protein n=1 Tax=Portunus trituberculatus TaxID=210409 RepID=A0A5B7FE54_PORTR|nr:hypothetical protein [Portunus trituberculatus]
MCCNNFITQCIPLLHCIFQYPSHTASSLSSLHDLLSFHHLLSLAPGLPCQSFSMPLTILYIVIRSPHSLLSSVLHMLGPLVPAPSL